MNSVSMKPGETQFTVMWRLATSLARLGSSVVGLALYANASRGGGDADDAPPALAEHPLRSQLEHRETAVQVDVDHLVPVLLREHGHHAIDADARAMHEYVKMVVLLVKGVEEGFNCAVITYVALDCKQFSLVFRQAFNESGGGLTVGCVKGIDTCAGLKESLCDGGADAACAARDDGCPVGEVVGDHDVAVGVLECRGFRIC